MSASSQPPAVWNEERARQLLGKRALVGITRLNPDDSVIEQVQFYGTVEAVDARNGITLLLEGSSKGERFNLPPALHFFEPARPGQYTLRSTGETVTDPDYLVTCTQRKPYQ